MAEYLIDLDEATTAAIHLSRHFRARLLDQDCFWSLLDCFKTFTH